MHKDILDEKQLELLPLVQKFRDKFGLVGGTAIALHIGHRESIDFDLFCCETIDNSKIRNTIKTHFDNDIDIKVIRDEVGEYSVFLKGVKFTFFHYPFQIEFDVAFEDIINTTNLLTLSAMKAYALGRRAKWKDYVDLYFIFKQYSLDEVAQNTKNIFGDEFNAKNFREQLNYFDDIDYTEKIIFHNKMDVSDEEIKKTLSKISVS